MKEYNYSDVVKIDKTGILFSDTKYMKFEKCRYEWAKENNISVADTVCAGLRFSEKNEGYFIFYDTERIKLSFKFKGIFRCRRSREKFGEMQMTLNRYGYTSYDAS